MKKTILFLIALLLLYFSVLSMSVFCMGDSDASADKDAIKKAALDYIEGWYNGDDERMERALHPNLVKRIIKNPETNSILEELDMETMVGYTKYGGGKNVPKDSYEIEIKILDVQNNIASVMAKSEYIDYIHLGKFNNRWVIINVLWDFNK